MKRDMIALWPEDVKRVIDRRKTQHRTPINPQPEISERSGFVWKGAMYGRGATEIETRRNFEKGCGLIGAIGNRILVQECFRIPAEFDDKTVTEVGQACVSAGYRHPWVPVLYEADGKRENWKTWSTGNTEPGVLRHAVRMPRWLCRLTLVLVSGGVERLQRISESDCCAEGMGSPITRDCKRPRFQAWWTTRYGPKAWDQDPWVRVLRFELANNRTAE